MAERIINLGSEVDSKNEPILEKDYFVIDSLQKQSRKASYAEILKQLKYDTFLSTRSCVWNAVYPFRVGDRVNYLGYWYELLFCVFSQSLFEFNVLFSPLFCWCWIRFYPQFHTVLKWCFGEMIGKRWSK